MKDRGKYQCNYNIGGGIGILEMPIIQRDLKLQQKPTNGRQAYQYLMNAIQDEIGELQIMLVKLSDPEAKREFIRGWGPHIRSITVRS